MSKITDDLEKELEGMLRSSLRGFLKILTLMIIARRPIYGYKIIEEVERRTLGLWKPSPGALYPILKELERKNYLKSHRSHEGGRERVYYMITEKGLNLVKLIDEKLDRFRDMILDSVREKASLIRGLSTEDLRTIRKRLETWKETLCDVINIIDRELSRRLVKNVGST